LIFLFAVSVVHTTKHVPKAPQFSVEENVSVSGFLTILQVTKFLPKGIDVLLVLLTVNHKTQTKADAVTGIFPSNPH